MDKKTKIQNPTAYKAIKNIEDENDRLNKIIWVIRSICELAGYNRKMN